jgi:hypothetical protein
MARYSAPLADIRFALYDVLDVESLFKRLPGFENATRDVVDAVLDEAAKFTEQVLAPLNQTGDQEGCHFDPATASVITPAGFKHAYEQYVANGWAGLTSPAAYGGQDMPQTLGGAVKEMLDSANLSWGNYPLLSHGATEALLQHGEDWQREAFLKPIVEGRWTGTMCLTEPHCGTDLGLLKTKAEPAGDGGYRISGTKIFITAGEHDLTENIVHLVLARLPDAPTGVKGISLFVVPKFKVGRDGKLGARNALVRRDRAQDGHQGLGDVHDELRRRGRLSHRRAEQGPQCDVHDDEHRTPRGRPAGPRADRARVSELARVCARAPADARALGREIPRQAGRSADRASGYPAHAADAESVRRRLPPARAVCVHAGRHPQALAGSRRTRAR